MQSTIMYTSVRLKGIKGNTSLVIVTVNLVRFSFDLIGKTLNLTHLVAQEEKITKYTFRSKADLIRVVDEITTALC